MQVCGYCIVRTTLSENPGSHASWKQVPVDAPQVHCSTVYDQTSLKGRGSVIYDKPHRFTAGKESGNGLCVR